MAFLQRSSTKGVFFRFPVLHRERVLVKKSVADSSRWIKRVGGGGGACKSNVIMTIDVLRLFEE